MFSVAVLLFTIAILLCLWIVRENCRRPKNFPPGPPSLPIYGCYWLLLKENYYYMHKALSRMCAKYKTDILGFYVGPFPYVTIQSYSLIKELLNRDEFQGRPDGVIIRNRGRGDLRGIFFTDGRLWKDQRRFTMRNMRDFGFGRRDSNVEDIAEGEVRAMVNFLLSSPKPADSDVCIRKGVVMLPDFFYGPTMNSILQLLTATHQEYDKEVRDFGRAGTRFLLSVDVTGNAIGKTQWLRFIAPDFFRWTSSIVDNEVMLQYVRTCIANHKATFDKDHLRDFIDVYLNELQNLETIDQKDTSFSDKQLEYVILDLLSPVPIGVSAALSFLLVNLLYSSKIQDNLHNEIDRVVGKSRLPTLNDRKNMPYTEATIRESMRKDTLLPLGLPRRCTKDTVLGGYYIPKGTSVIPNVWAMHNYVELWGDPENFRPERFLDDKGLLIGKDYTIPFGGGKRLCIGETFTRNTLFLFLTGLLQNFSIKFADGHPKPDLNNLHSGITVGLKDSWIEFVPRH